MLDILAGQERALCTLWREALDRAVTMAEAGRTIPVELLDRIAQLEARVGALVTVQWTVEHRQEPREPEFSFELPAEELARRIANSGGGRS